jgi:hypothetical protein
MQQDMKLKLRRDRMEDRRQLLALFDGVKRKLDFEGFDDYQRQAYETIIGGAEKAFDLSQEDPRMIERYDTSRLCNPESVRLGPDGKQKGFYPRYVDHGKTHGQGTAAGAAAGGSGLRVRHGDDQFRLGHARRRQ